MSSENTVTIWIADEINGTLSLTTIPAAMLSRLQRARAQSDGQWFDAYIWIG
jgi:hypothetical protein